MIAPGDIVVRKDNDQRFVVVDVADYRGENDGGIRDVFAVLRYPDDDPNRRLNEDGSDRIVGAVSFGELEKVGHI